MLKYIKSFRSFAGEAGAVGAAFDEGFRQGEMAGLAAAAPEQETLDRAYTDGVRAGYISGLNKGSQYNCRVRETDLRAPSTAPDPAAWISGVDRR